jgi:hypothetical protein
MRAGGFLIRAPFAIAALVVVAVWHSLRNVGLLLWAGGWVLFLPLRFIENVVWDAVFGGDEAGIAAWKEFKSECRLDVREWRNTFGESAKRYERVLRWWRAR